VNSGIGNYGPTEDLFQVAPKSGIRSSSSMSGAHQFKLPEARDTVLVPRQWPVMVPAATGVL